MATPEEIPFNTRLPWHPLPLPKHEEAREVPRLTQRRAEHARTHPIMNVAQEAVLVEIGNPLPEEGWDDVIEKSAMKTHHPERPAHFWLGLMLVMMLISISGIVVLAVSK